VPVRASLRPTWVTWTVVLAPFVFVPILSVLRFDLTLFALSRVVIDLPFQAARHLGLPVGRRGDWFGLAFPNALGWTLIGPTDLAGLYLLGSVASAAWTRVQRGPIIGRPARSSPLGARAGP
jgi:hypothetical protein